MFMVYSSCPHIGTEILIAGSYKEVGRAQEELEKELVESRAAEERLERDLTQARRSEDLILACLGVGFWA